MSGWCVGFSRCLTSLSPLRTNEPNFKERCSPSKRGGKGGWRVDFELSAKSWGVLRSPP